MSTASETEYRVIEVRDLTESTYILRLERNGLAFTAGQCISLGIPGQGVNREYSTYSGEQDDYMDFLVREVNGGLVSTALRASKPGDPIALSGPYGQFVLEKPDDPSRSYLFIGSGTGIAPFHAFARTHAELDYRVLHGVRFTRECYDAQNYADGRYISCVTQEDGGDFRGRVTDYLRAHPIDPSVICYLCGNRGMLAEAYDILREQGLPGDNLYTEAFF